jgi:hypothetical protein
LSKVKTNRRLELDDKADWKKIAFMNLKNMKNVVFCNNIYVIKTDDSIAGYDQSNNKILWKINMEKYPSMEQEDISMTKYGKYIILLIQKSLSSQWVVCIESLTGNIIWNFKEGNFTNYKLIPIFSDRRSIPVINERKENFANNKYVVFLDPETGKKIGEIKDPLSLGLELIEGLFAGDNIWLYNFTNHSKGGFFKLSIESNDKIFNKIFADNIQSVRYLNGFIYFLSIENETQDYYIGRINSANSALDKILWCEKAKPAYKWKIINSFIGDENKILISWGKKSDDTPGHTEINRRFGLFDFKSGKFIHQDIYSCHGNFVTTHNGIFIGDDKFIDIESGIPINTRLKINQSFGTARYENELLFLSNSEKIEIYKWSVDEFEVKKVSADGMKSYSLKEKIAGL